MRFPTCRPAGAPSAPSAPRSPRAPCAPRSPRAPCAPRSPRAPCAPRSPRAPCAPGALLLLLLLAPRWPQAEAGPAGAVGTRELRCTCLRTSPRIHPQTIAGLQVTPAGPHCARVEVIASLKNGRTVCLDPEAPGVRRFLERTLGRANNQRR